MLVKQWFSDISIHLFPFTDVFCFQMFLNALKSYSSITDDCSFRSLHTRVKKKKA